MEVLTRFYPGSRSLVVGHRWVDGGLRARHTPLGDRRVGLSRDRKSTELPAGSDEATLER